MILRFIAGDWWAMPTLLCDLYLAIMKIINLDKLYCDEQFL